MDTLSRLIVLCFLLACGVVQAATYPAFYKIPGGDAVLGGGPSSGSTREAAAQAFMAARQSIPLGASCAAGSPGAKRKVTAYEYNNTTVWFTYVDAPCTGVFGSETRQWSYSFQTVCPTGTLSGTTCTYTCQSGHTFNSSTGLCMPPCAENQERNTQTQACDCKSIAAAGKFMVPGDEYTGCNNGCSMVLKNGWYDKTNNVTWGSWGQPGTTCTAADKTVVTNSDPKVEAAKQCSAGTCPGTVNGQSVCVPCDKTKQTETTTAGTTSSTTASGATSSTTTNQSDSETSRTECKDGSCTTTTTSTTVGPNGDKVDKTTTKTEPQSDYCTQNPKAAVCKGTESSWGGSCGSFSCDGDAVTCAIAQASWKSACALDIDETDPKVTAGQAAMSGGDRPGDHPGNSPEQNAFTANIDQSNPFSSECPADIPLDVMGQSIAIPLSHACDSLKFMGQIAVAFAMLGAAFIVFGGIKG